MYRKLYEEKKRLSILHTQYCVHTGKCLKPEQFLKAEHLLKHALPYSDRSFYGHDC